MSFVNNVKTTIHSAFNATTTSIQVLKATAPFNNPPTSGTLTFMDSLSSPTKIEVVTYTGRTDNGSYWTITGVTRGQESSTASSFDVEAYVIQTWTAEHANIATTRINGVENSVEFISTAGQTTFTTPYDAGYLDVYLNGILLAITDYTATDGANIVLDVGASVSDVVYIQAFGTFALADHYTKTAADSLLAAKVDDSQVLTNVPSGALFTDNNTVYTHPTNHAISVITVLQDVLDDNVDDGQVLTNVPSGAVFTDTETTTSISHNGSTKTLSYTDETGTTTNIDLTAYVDDTNLARLVSGSLAGATGIATFTRDDSSTFTIDMSDLLDTDTNTWRGIDNTPVNGQTSESISSDWAFDHAASSTAHPRDTRNQIAGTYNNYVLPASVIHQTELSSSTSSTSTTVAANSAAVKAAYDRSWPNTTYTATQMRDAIKTVDGSGSGLDADLLDGQHASAFVLESNVNNYVGTGWSNVVGKIPRIAADGRIELGRYTDFKTTNSNADYDIRLDCESANVLNVIGGGLEIGGSAVWHAGNDGSGSGLDADLLDGQQGSAYLLKTGGTVTGNVRVNGSFQLDGHTVFNGNDTWMRTVSDAGWYNATYGGGIHMVDSTWVRTYGGKSLYVANTIASSGSITAYYSDMRLKTSTGNIENALDKVKSLNGFTYIENDLARSLGYSNTKQQVGISAQQIQAVLPEAVSLAPIDMETDEFSGEITSKSGEDYLTVDYSRIVPLLIEAIKEQQTQIDELKEIIKCQ